jgi:flagellar hook protein FlgE
MGSAISIGTTGLTASQKQMDVIGNNLANSNTLGFKSGSTYFASMLNQSLSGSGAMSVGQGVSVDAIATQYTQGSFENTGNATDLAIDGDGFFIVKDPEGALYYTRAGNFHINKEGFLVDNSDYKVQGFNLFSSNQTIGTDTNDTRIADNISLKNVQSAPSATTDTSAGANLDESTTYGGKFNVSQTVFDSKGALHNLSITFQKTEEPGMWGFDATLDGVTSQTADQSACGILFDEDGALTGLYKGDIENTAAGAKATGTITSTGTQVTANDTVTINGKVYTFVASPASEGDVAIGADAAETLDNLQMAINRTDPAVNDGVKYMVAAAHPTVEAADSTTTILTLRALTAGTAGNALTLAESAATLSPSAAVLAGGSVITLTASAVSKPGQICQDATGIELTKGVATGVWDVTADGGYTNALAWQETTGGVNYLKVDLDGKGGSDVVFTLPDAGVTGDTVTFDVVKSTVGLQDVGLTFGDLGNGATIGESSGSGPAIQNKITWNLLSDEINKITGYASTSVVKSLSNNGYASGVLKGLSIGSDGIISGAFTNGQTSNLGEIVMADFPNAAGLKKVGNYFGETNDSGEAIQNTPGSGGLGEVLSNSLEISNTDVAKEFVNMITAQRAYQASAKVITTSNDMLTELMNIKR